MTFLKNLAVSLFSFLLFLALSIFGLAFTVMSTVLNPDFISAQISRLDIAALVEERVNIESPAGLPDLNETVHRAVSSMEPRIKEEASAAVHAVYDYLLGKTPTPNLAATLRNTLFSADFVSAAVEAIDLAPIIAPLISQNLSQSIPVEIPGLDRYVAEAVAAEEPALKARLVAVSGQVSDYLLGITPSLSASLPLDQVTQRLRDRLRQVFIDSPPSVYAAIPGDLRGAAFDQLYEQVSPAIRSNYPLDETRFGDARANVTHGLAQAEERLIQARQYVSDVRQVYMLLIAAIIIFVLGIILLIRQVKGIARQLGAPLLVSGAIGYASILVTRHLISTGRLRLPVAPSAHELPASLEPWLLQFTSDILKPLGTFSLALLVAGAVLVAILLVYKRKRS